MGLLVAGVLAGCGGGGGGSSSSSATGSLPELQGVWVGTQTDILSHLSEEEGSPDTSKGDCEDGLEEVCDSVLEMDDDGTPTDATAGQLQFATTAHDDLYRASGSELGSGEVLYAILNADGENAVVLHWKPGGTGFLTISMKSKYDSDPGLPGVTYDATALNGTILGGTTYTFAADGSPNTPVTGQSITLNSGNDTELQFTDADTLNGVTLAPDGDSGMPVLRSVIEPATQDQYLGIFHTGDNTPAGGDNLFTTGAIIFETVVAIPTRADSSAVSLLVVTCDGNYSDCSDGDGGNGEMPDISAWDITKYAFTLLTKTGSAPVR